MHSAAQQREGLRMLEGESRLLEIAREVSQLLRDSGLKGAIIGGVAVVLHGHVRTTVDVDVYTESAEKLAAVLTQHAYAFDTARCEFRKHDLPVHIVTAAQVRTPPEPTIEVQGIRVPSLAALISMKLRSGTRDPLRAQDLADVIGLIRQNKLSGDFAAQVAAEVRGEFRKLAKAIARDPRSNKE
jgi:hypothetical protein